MKNLLLFISVLLFSAFSCKKENDNELTSNGTIMYTGSPATDGCNWVIVVDSTYYYPVNLPEDFKIEGEYKVKLSYTLTGENYSCFYPMATMPEIWIDEIKFQ